MFLTIPTAMRPSCNFLALKRDCEDMRSEVFRKHIEQFFFTFQLMRRLLIFIINFYVGLQLLWEVVISMCKQSATPLYLRLLCGHGGGF